jgi:hypothetical protein
MSPDLETQLRRMAAARTVSPADIDTSCLMPVFAPAHFFSSGKWCGPHVRLHLQAMALTWAVLQPDAVMSYITFEAQAYWDGKDLDWKRLAMRNLANATNDKDGARTLCRASGKPYAIAFMYEDGLGSSRLLLRQGLENMFPGGYNVALPERSCGFAFSADVSPDEARTVQGIVDRCYRHGTYPLLPGSYQAEDLLPAT